MYKTDRCEHVSTRMTDFFELQYTKSPLTTLIDLKLFNWSNRKFGWEANFLTTQGEN